MTHQPAPVTNDVKYDDASFWTTPHSPTRPLAVTPNPRNEVTADWDDDDNTQKETVSPSVVTNGNIVPPSGSKLTPEEFKARRLAALTVWDDDNEEQPVTPTPPPVTAPTSVVTPTPVGRRRSPIRFTHAQLIVMFRAKAAGYTVKDITAWLNSSHTGLPITHNAVHNRLKRGYIPRPVVKTITPEQVLAWMQESESWVWEAGAGEGRTGDE